MFVCSKQSCFKSAWPRCWFYIAILFSYIAVVEKVAIFLEIVQRRVKVVVVEEVVVVVVGNAMNAVKKATWPVTAREISHYTEPCQHRNGTPYWFGAMACDEDNVVGLNAWYDFGWFLFCHREKNGCFDWKINHHRYCSFIPRKMHSCILNVYKNSRVFVFANGRIMQNGEMGKFS